MSKRNRNQGSNAVAAPTPVADNAEKLAQEKSRFYDDFRRELTVKQNSNSENYDKNILTLSSAGLALSLAFIKDIVPRADMVGHNVLLMSWLFFGLAIVATLVSYQFSQMAIQAALHDAGEYYLKGREEFQTRECAWARWTGRLNWASGTLFVAAMAATSLFVVKNFPSQIHEHVSTVQSAPPGGHPPVPQADHRSTDQPASSNHPTTKEVNHEQTIPTPK